MRFSDGLYVHWTEVSGSTMLNTCERARARMGEPARWWAQVHAPMCGNRLCLAIAEVVGLQVEEGMARPAIPSVLRLGAHREQKREAEQQSRPRQHRQSTITHEKLAAPPHAPRRPRCSAGCIARPCEGMHASMRPRRAGGARAGRARAGLYWRGRAARAQLRPRAARRAPRPAALRGPDSPSAIAGTCQGHPMGWASSPRRGAGGR